MSEESQQKKKKLMYAVISVASVIALIVGVTYAWFFNQSDMKTLLAVKSPSEISILGPNGTEMSSIDLNYTSADKSGDTVTIRRVFCVQTAAEAHRLEIVHTTNLKGLKFNLYKVSSEGTNTVTDGGAEYRYDNTPIAGSYLNIDEKSTTKDYKYAEDTYHEKNYEKDSVVQKHAEPIYWLANENLLTDQSDANKITVGNTIYHRTYYVCEVSWTEETKETDLFYILAENADIQSNTQNN